MRKFIIFALTLAAAATVQAAPNVTNATQKGSLLIFPDVRIDGHNSFDTLIRIQNDGGSDVDVICYWMDGNKNRVDFIIPVTRNQAVWFDARTGRGTYQVNVFPQSPANGFANPFLGNFNGPYLKGMLACWAVDGGAQNQVKWNHLSGTATVYEPGTGAYEYNAYAFYAPTGTDLQPLGTAGKLNLNGVEYDSCPLYQIGQFTPNYFDNGQGQFGIHRVYNNRLAIVGCTLDLTQDWIPVFTKLQFDVWNEEEVKFTGAFDCADSWHELELEDYDLDSAGQNFSADVLGTFAARFRVQGVQSTQCRVPEDRVALRINGSQQDNPGDQLPTQPAGIVAVHSTFLGEVQVNQYLVGTTLTNAGKFNGTISWDPEGAVPEGGIR